MTKWSSFAITRSVFGLGAAGAGRDEEGGGTSFVSGGGAEAEAGAGGAGGGTVTQPATAAMARASNQTEAVLLQWGEGAPDAFPQIPAAQPGSAGLRPWIRAWRLGA